MEQEAVAEAGVLHRLFTMMTVDTTRGMEARRSTQERTTMGELMATLTSALYLLCLFSSLFPCLFIRSSVPSHTLLLPSNLLFWSHPPYCCRAHPLGMAAMAASPRA